MQSATEVVARLHGGSSCGSRLRGKVAIVTGAGRGIGRATALALANEGAAVMAVSRTPEEIEQTAAAMRGRGQPVLGLAADVSEPLAVERLVTRTVETFGGVHVLVNNAAVLGPIGPLVDNDPAAWIQTILINLVGPFLCSREVLPYMIRQRSGKIVNLSGGGAAAPRRRFSAYAASKAALVRLTETLAEEVRHQNIQVNAIAPGAVNTRMLDQVLAAGDLAGDLALAEARRQLKSGGTVPELAAALVVFLASEESGSLTGKLISAPHDDWESWGSEHISELMAAPWLTLRRLDPHTLRPLLEMSRQLCVLASRVAV